jgi:hypothetical protein
VAIQASFSSGVIYPPQHTSPCFEVVDSSTAHKEANHSSGPLGSKSEHHWFEMGSILLPKMDVCEPQVLFDLSF